MGWCSAALPEPVPWLAFKPTWVPCRVGVAGDAGPVVSAAPATVPWEHVLGPDVMPGVPLLGQTLSAGGVATDALRAADGAIRVRP